MPVQEADEGGRCGAHLEDTTLCTMDVLKTLYYEKSFFKKENLYYSVGYTIYYIRRLLMGDHWAFSRGRRFHLEEV